MKLLTKTTLSLLLLTSSVAGTAAYAADSAAVLNSNGTPMLQVSTVAGSGAYTEQDGAAAEASFRMPTGVAIGADKTVYIADATNDKIRKLSGGIVSTAAGLPISVILDNKGLPQGALVDGKAERSLFNNPLALAVDGKGSVYVADSDNHAVRKIDTSGNVTTLAGNGVLGLKDGKGAEAQLYYPTGIAVTADGTVYVADTLNHVIRKITADGTVSTLNAASKRAVKLSASVVRPAGDYRDGDLKTALFNEPTGLALDAKGNLYVSDSGNQRIRYIDFAAGKVTTVAGSGTGENGTLYAKASLYAEGDYADGAADQAMFNFPKGIAVDPNGGLVVADSLNHAVRYIKDGVVSTLAGTPNDHGFHDGTESGALFNVPTGVAIDTDGTIYVADSGNNRIRQLEAYQLPVLTKDNLVKVVVENKQIAFDAQPEIENGRTMVPVRFIAEELGYEVKFSDDQTVSLVKGDTTVELYVGKTGLTRKEAGQADVSKPTDVAPYIKDGRTYVPVRFFAEEIGLDVQWAGEVRAAVLRTK
ncbi:stalk domain-containing protein [Paenibacillus chartarius]|uniref:Stalk domain-containing protein n=1 Tax=Paenibacillus chartarius TaxID=747481 RepID=A0ABV6DM89_9BACL